MVITKHTRDFIENLIDYYISEAPSYKQLAELYSPEVQAVDDAAFGIIAGCVYSAFLRAYENENKTVELDDMQEFNQIIKDKAAIIKKAVMGAKLPE
ncbi:MAG: hypothetical protein AB1299_02860 [Thermoproteota archaeon]|jgi:hypothetical protein|nr:hypothetical protein [Candidatus Nitrosotenuis sp.]